MFRTYELNLLQYLCLFAIVSSIGRGSSGTFVYFPWTYFHTLQQHMLLENIIFGLFVKA